MSFVTTWLVSVLKLRTVLYIATTSVYFTDLRPAFISLLDTTTLGHQEILKDLASSHTVMAVALTGVLFLQGGQAWAERADSARSQPKMMPAPPSRPERSAKSPTPPSEVSEATVTGPASPRIPASPLKSTRKRK